MESSLSVVLVLLQELAAEIHERTLTSCNWATLLDEFAITVVLAAILACARTAAAMCKQPLSFVHVTINKYSLSKPILSNSQQIHSMHRLLTVDDSCSYSISMNQALSVSTVQ